MADACSFSYDLSVIVPVYNSEAYLARCVESLDAQTAAQTSFEVVLVNDGSPDGSLAICQQLVAERANYVLVDQENQGVSAARNAGMRAASGRYLMFLDPDDTLSAPSIEAIVKTFDACGDAVDLLTYPLCYHEIETGKQHRNQRERWFAGSGAYDLADVPQVAQSTINVVLRNAGDQTPCFDTSREIYEDQVFDTALLERKCAIGWCAEAEYRYYRSATNTSSRRDRPELTFGDVISAFELFLQMAERTPRFAPYAYALILYNVGWRFRAGKLFPVFGSEETCRKNCGRLAAVLGAIPAESWAASPYLSELWPVDQAILQDRKLTVVGHCLAAPSLAEGLVVTAKGSEQPVSLEPAFPQGESDADVWCWKYSFTLPVRGGRPFDAELRPHGEGLQPDLIFRVTRSNGRKLNNHLREFGDWRLELKGARLHVGTIKDLPLWTMPLLRPVMWLHDRRRTGDYDVKRVDELRIVLPQAVRKRRGEVSWLYDDGPQAGSEQRVALAKLRADHGRAAAAKIVQRYVVNGPEDEAAAELGARAIQRGSFEHIVCLLAAQMVVTSCADVSEILPCEDAVFDRVRDFTRASQWYELVRDTSEVVFAPAFDKISAP